MTKRDLTKLTPAQRTALILKTNKNTRVDTPTQADKDRTAAIDGRYGVHGSEK